MPPQRFDVLFEPLIDELADTAAARHGALTSRPHSALRYGGTYIASYARSFAQKKNGFHLQRTKS